MVDALGTSLSRGQQIVGVFMFGMSLGQIPSGLASDRFGRLPALYAGMGLFVIAASVAALVNDMELLLAEAGTLRKLERPPRPFPQIHNHARPANGYCGVDCGSQFTRDTGHG